MQYGKANGEVFLGRDYSRQQDYSDEVAAFIDEEVRKLINAAHEEAREILSTHKDAMERMVAELLEKETVDRDEVADIFSDVPKWEHTAEGSLRIRYPENPILPQPREDEDRIAAASEVEEPDTDAPATQRVTKGLRPTSRPADAGA